MGFLQQNVAITPTDITLTTTEKPLVPTFVLTLGTQMRLELDDRSCLGCLAGMSSESKYDGCLDESAG